MVSGDRESLIYGVRISSVGPGKSTGSDVTYNPSSMDLAMKLHYLKAIYFFDGPACRELTVSRIKEPTFTLFNDFFMTCGRFRRSESGRPFIKCNDCGARFIEAHCGKTVDEWLQETAGDWSAQKLLVSQQVIGPELPFSPPIYMQLTRFKCGGIAIGLSWAHVLGDAFSAADFMNRLSRLVFGGSPTKSINGAKPEKTTSRPSSAKAPLSLKIVEPVGDLWLAPNNCTMATLSFNLSATHLAKLQNQSGLDRNPVFESICAILWRAIARLRKRSEPTTVTLCKPKRESKILSNSQVISTVEAGFSVSDADPRELAKLLMANQAEDESRLIEEAVERDDGVSDFVFYGGNLTFVRWEDANFYGHGLGFERPRFVYYTVQGVGDEGVVLVLPGPEDVGGERFVTVVLPENEIVGLRSELMANGVLPERPYLMEESCGDC